MDTKFNVQKLTVDGWVTVQSFFFEEAAEHFAVSLFLNGVPRSKVRITQ